MLALPPRNILLLAYYCEDVTLRGNVDSFSFLNKITITEQPNLHLHVV